MHTLDTCQGCKVFRYVASGAYGRLCDSCYYARAGEVSRAGARLADAGTRRAFNLPTVEPCEVCEREYSHAETCPLYID